LAKLLELLRRGTLDVALAALPLESGWCMMPPLFFEPFRLVCPAEHMLAKPVAAAPAGAGLDAAAYPAGHPIGLSDLSGDDLLLLEEGHCLRDQAISLCAHAGQGRLATSLETLWHMIAAGEGYSVLPALSTAGREELAGLVAVRPLDDPDAGRTLALAWRRTDPRGQEFEALAVVLRAGLPEGVMGLGG
jgi:LysR family hydrogen peroxide-inducible transcriptional activator